MFLGFFFIIDVFLFDKLNHFGDSWALLLMDFLLNGSMAKLQNGSTLWSTFTYSTVVTVVRKNMPALIHSMRINKIPSGKLT